MKVMKAILFALVLTFGVAAAAKATASSCCGSAECCESCTGC
jgi:hypothetical protein